MAAWSTGPFVTAITSCRCSTSYHRTEPKLRATVGVPVDYRGITLRFRAVVAEDPVVPHVKMLAKVGPWAPMPLWATIEIAHRAVKGAGSAEIAMRQAGG